MHSKEKILGGMALSNGYERSDEANHITFYANKDFHKVLEGVFGKRFREYREKWDVCAKHEVVPMFPLELDINLDFACNLKCRCCPQGLADSDPIKQAFVDKKAKMDFGLFESIIDEGVENNLYSANLSNFNEPLINPDFPKAIKYCRDQGLVDVLFNSNGLLLDEKKAIEILDAEPTRVAFSIDALSKETYSKLRIGSDYDVVVGNVKRFLKLKEERGQVLPLTRVSFIVTKQNYCEKDAFLEYWRNKVDFVCLQDYRNMFIGSEYYKNRQELCPPKKVSERERQEKPFKCISPFQRMSIIASGDVIPCCNIPGFLYTVGNIKEQSLQDVWFGKRMNHIRRTVNQGWSEKPMACKLCFAGLKQKIPSGAFEKLSVLEAKREGTRRFL